jgi:ABC-type transport system substrate-binding protein
MRPKAGRHPENVQSRQPGEHVDPRGGDGLRRRADDGVFNNLVMYDQHVPQSSLQSIVPDLAIGWSWNEDGTELTLPLREGVTWHDGKPFTAKDVQCTFEMLTGKSSDKLRVNPRKAWYGEPRQLEYH